MKKFLLSLIALLGVGTYALADGFSVADVEIRQGKTGVLELVFNTESNYGRSYQIDFDLPEGIVATSVEAGEGVTAAVGKYMLDGNVYEGAYRVAYTDFDESPLRNGVAAYITLEDTEGYPVNTEFTVTVKNQEYVVQDAETSTTQKVNPAEFTFKIKIVEDVMVLDENSTEMPVAATNQTVLVKRTIKANQWSTLCLPFAMSEDQVKAAFGDDVKLADYTGWTYEEDDDANMKAITINFTSTSTIAENKPLVIKPTSDITSFKVENVNINPDDAEIEIKESVRNRRNGTMVGVYVAETVLDEDFLFLSGNNFYYSTGTTKMKAFRAYFDMYFILDEPYKSKPSASMVKIAIDQDETTSIEDLRFVNSNGAVYTVDGKFIGRDVDLKKLQKGIYVIDGKKVAIK